MHGTRTQASRRRKCKVYVGSETIPHTDRITSKLVFFYCTTPFVLAAVSIYASLQHRRGPALFLPIGYGALGLLGWIIQIAIQGKCTFGNGGRGTFSIQKSPEFCGFSLRNNWQPAGTWQTGIGVSMGVTWVSLLMLLL